MSEPPSSSESAPSYGNGSFKFLTPVETQSKFEIPLITKNLQYTEGVEKAISQVFEPSSNTVFDSENFDPTSYINDKFQHEEDLLKVESVMLALRQQIRSMDSKILESIRKQSTSGEVASGEITEVKGSIQTLFSRIQEIQTKAQQSEAMVQKITKDIKFLDYGKKNLTQSITTLQRLHMLVSTIEKLKAMTKKRQYRPAADLLDAVNSLIDYFQNFNQIQKIVELRQEVEDIKKQLKEQIFKDFKSLDALADTTAGKGTSATAESILADGCQCADALGEHVRADLITQFAKQQNSLYRMIFAKEKRDSKLESIQQRFSWIKKKLRNYEERFGDIFPKGWYVANELAYEFCVATKEDVLALLREGRDGLDAIVLHNSLLATIKFEREMHAKYYVPPESEIIQKQEKELQAINEQLSQFGHLEDGEEEETVENASEDRKEKLKLVVRKRNIEKSLAQKKSAQNGSDPAPEGTTTQPSRSNSIRLPSMRTRERKETQKRAAKVFNFIGLISTTFEDFMGAYVNFELKTMEEKISFILKQETWDGNEDTNSSHGLFIYISESMRNVTAFSRGKTFLKIVDVWKRCLRIYATSLLNKLPKIVPASSISKGDAILAKIEYIGGLMSNQSSNETPTVTSLTAKDKVAVCYIIHLADFCRENIENMEEEIKAKMLEPLKVKVDLYEDQKRFSKVLKSAIEVIILSWMNAVEPEFSKMAKLPWGSVDFVGDHSDYVSNISKILGELVPQIATRIPKPNFKYLCDCFILTFFDVFISTIYKCRRFSQHGAEQLLLDLTALSTMMKSLLNVGDEKRFDEEDVQHFAKQIHQRAHKAEMIIKVVQAPLEATIQMYKALIPEGSIHDFSKLLDLKGVGKNEKAILLERFEQVKPATESKTANSTTSLAQTSSSIGNTNPENGEGSGISHMLAKAFSFNQGKTG